MAHDHRDKQHKEEPAVDHPPQPGPPLLSHYKHGYHKLRKSSPILFHKMKRSRTEASLYTVFVSMSLKSSHKSQKKKSSSSSKRINLSVQDIKDGKGDIYAFKTHQFNPQNNKNTSAMLCKWSDQAFKPIMQISEGVKGSMREPEMEISCTNAPSARTEAGKTIVVVRLGV